MKRMTRIGALALLAIAAQVGGCGDGKDGTSCTAQDDGSSKKIVCTDGTQITLHDGTNGTNGTSCSVTDNGDDTKTITCGSTSVVVADGTDTDLRVVITDRQFNPAKTAVAFNFECSRGSCTFECKLDAAEFAACHSPAIHPVLGAGTHTFQVRAVQGDALSNPSLVQWSTRNYSANHIILLIGDGFQMEHAIAASRYLYGTDFGLSWESFPVSAYVSTWDVTAYNRYAYASSHPPYNRYTFNPNIGYDVVQGGAAPFPVTDAATAASYFLTKLGSYANPTSTAVPATDSASAATAIATGLKTDEGNLAWLPGDPSAGSLRTIAEDLRDYLGYRIGVTSTVPFTHATPAGFVAHNVSRNNYYTGYKGYTGTGVAEDIITNVRPHVVIGGGHQLLNNPGWDTTKGYISQAAYDAIKVDPDYVFVERQAGADGSAALSTAAAAAVTGDKRLFGLYGGAGGNFESPMPVDSAGDPQVNRVTTENPTMTESVVAALQVLNDGGTGFFLMAEQGDIDWANHDNDFARMVGLMWDLDEATKAVVDFVDQPGDNIDWSNTLLIVTTDHANSYLRLNATQPLGAGELPLQQELDRNGNGKHDDGDWQYPDGEVTYGTTGHTNELVTLFARGDAAHLLTEMQGLWYPGTEIVDNTQLFELMRIAAGL